jgi:mRNA interferase RelE/StbE
MNYSLTIKKRASKALAKLPNEDYEQVRDAIRDLAKTPRP